MDGFPKRAVQLALLVLAFLAIRYGYQMYQEHKAVVSLDQNAQQRTAGPAANQQDAAGQPKAAVELTRQQAAARTFLTFYAQNTRARAEYCDEHATSIQPFLSAFQNAHSKELDAAHTALSGTDINEDQIYSAARDQMRGIIDNDMNFLATSTKTEAKGACELVASRADEFVDRLQFAKMQPAVDQLLLGGQ